VRILANAPYSRFSVGAALLTPDGRVFPGCNVENQSFGLTLCAEQSALVAAIAEGCPTFPALAIVSDTDVPISPFGACSRVLAKFSPDMQIILAYLNGQSEIFSLTELLPHARIVFSTTLESNVPRRNLSLRE